MIACDLEGLHVVLAERLATLRSELVRDCQTSLEKFIQLGGLVENAIGAELCATVANLGCRIVREDQGSLVWQTVAAFTQHAQTRAFPQEHVDHDQLPRGSVSLHCNFRVELSFRDRNNLQIGKLLHRRNEACADSFAVFNQDRLDGHCHGARWKCNENNVRREGGLLCKERARPRITGAVKCFMNEPISSAAVDGLAEALAKNTEAEHAVQDVADELGVLHAVLTSQVADIAVDGDDGTAVERTAQLEKKLSDTAEKMVEVNAALAEQHASLAHLAKAAS